MVSAAWRALGEEIARWREAGREVQFWWRDDDATRMDPALARLTALTAEFAVPIALAVIPDRAEPGLFAALGPRIDVLQHGADHANRAASAEKKTEFPASEPPASALARLAKGRERLRTLSAGRALAVLVPPWNRFPEALVPQIAAQGFVGLSAYGSRARSEAPRELTRINTHVDIIGWREDRRFAGEEAVLALALRHLAAKRTGAADAAEPTGWLTHHACHDEEAWSFLARLAEFVQKDSAVRWRRAGELFRGPGDA